jgi:long-chain acyl-CoA synthetase
VAQNEITESVPQRVKARVDSHPDAIAQYYKDGQGSYQKRSYADLWAEVEALGGSFLEAGVARGEHVGIIADNRQEWLVIDLALLSLGAIDVPRGTDATSDEITYILAHADCKLVVVEGLNQAKQLLDRKSDLPKLQALLLIDGSDGARKQVEKAGLEYRDYQELLSSGRELSKDAFRKEHAAGKPDDVATLIYTSGTTGEPKGVMLTHRSYIFQMDRTHSILHLTEKDIFLSVLPIWHSFERAVGYIVLNFAAAIAYSKPIGQVMMDDMAEIRPTWMTSVPRIWEGVRAAVYRNARKGSAVKQAMFHFFVGVGESHAYFTNMLLGRLPTFKPRYQALDVAMSIIPLIILTPFKLLGSLLVFSKLRGRLGGRFVAGVSGGGALPPYVDRFFQAAGIKLLEGYGLT